MSYKLPKLETKKSNYRGKGIYQTEFFNLAILSKKKSGKTTLIYNILRHTIDKKTMVLFFVSTFFKDATYKAIAKYLKKKKISYHGQTHFNEDGENLLEEFMEENQMEEDKNHPSSYDSTEVKERKTPLVSYMQFDESEPSAKITEEKKKEKKQINKFIIVFDDLSMDLRDQSVEKLLKKNRHFKTKVILSSQNITDLKPASFQQLDYCCLFKSFNDDTLKKLYERLDLWMDYEHFLKIYKQVVKVPFAFLFIDLVNQELRNGLNRRIV